MRYNSSELKQMATASAKLCAKEGILSLREKEGKFLNKTDVFTARWCRLVDNLLFYFKTKEETSDPHGVFVLEGSCVRPVTDSGEGRAFVLEFDGDSRSTYFLANEPTEAQEWMQALKDASYTKLKQKYEFLMKQQKEMLGEASENNDLQVPDSSPKSAPRETRSANSSPMLLRKKVPATECSVTLSDFEGVSDDRMTKKKPKKKDKMKRLLPSDSTAPLLEVSLDGLDLNIPKALDHKRLIEIRVLLLQPPALECKTVFKTEYVKASTSVHFLSTLSFYRSHLLTPHTQLHFHLCYHKEKISVSTLGMASCTVSDLFNLSRSLTLSIEHRDNSIGRLQLGVIREHVSSQLTKPSCEGQLSTLLLSSERPSNNAVRMTGVLNCRDIGSIPSLKSLYCEAISRTFKFPTMTGRFLSVQEIMLETRLSFTIPHLYLKLLLDQETGFIGTLNSISHLDEQLQPSRNHCIESRKVLLEQYHEAVKNVVNQGKMLSSFFKASIQKTDKELEFLPTNLHLQRMRVRSLDCITSASVPSQSSIGIEKSSPEVYDIVTVGAATAHCLKYKQGGLLSLIPTASEKLKKGVLYSILGQDDSSQEIAQLSATLPDIHKEAASLVSTLQTMFAAAKECDTVPPRKSAESSVSALSEKTCILVALLDNKELCKSLNVILGQTNGSLSAKSTLVSAGVNLVGSTGMEWEEMKSLVKTKLAKIVKSVHMLLDAADQSTASQQESGLWTFDGILEDLSELATKLDTVSNLALQGHAVHIMQSPQDSLEVVYRRDVVFSQVLSTCVCGVITTFISHLDNPALIETYAKYGMLVQFESLLSTYKNELGMLEDYVVGVTDLHKVSFCCNLSPEQDGNSFDHLLPKLHGTRNKIVVELQLDPVSFAKLPDSLKSGRMFKVIPVLFNVGINEEQSLAEKIGKTSSQEYINVDSYSHLLAYCENTKLSWSKPAVLDDCLKALNEAIRSKKSKNVKILHRAAEICRMVSGVRVTSCKSAKDRTAMSVTLEQAQILRQGHELAPNAFWSSLNCMRSVGTRRENTLKNTGVRKYAFSSVQLMTFPKQYKAPEGTFGGSQT